MTPRVAHKIERWVGRLLARALPGRTAEAFVRGLCARRSDVIVAAIRRGAKLDAVDLDHMPFHLPVDGPPGFEHLAGLFASTPLDHAVISMTVRQAAYLFGLVRMMDAQHVIEIGRYKGGSTLVIAAAMRGRGCFWSIDLAGDTTQLERGRTTRPADRQLADLCGRLGLTVDLIVGDSRVLDLETPEVDLVLIDGDHSYDGARSDFERFGRRVRIGGAVLFDDAFDHPVFRTTHSSGVPRLVREIQAQGDFTLVRVVDRLAHLSRLR